ncbi:hypothetical protein EC968_009724, partial [Mortierella alpina]
MSKFRRGDTRILLCTEAAGMGCDISDILRVVQFKFPPSISTLAQRLGRAARDPNLQGSGILMYTRSENRRTSSKAVDLIDFLTASCRREFFNKIFENEHKKTPNCCDLCDSPLPVTNRPDYRRVPRGSRHQVAPRLRRSRRPEHQLEARKKIEAWRSIELQELEKHSEIYDESSIMNDKAIKSLSTRFGDITVAEDIKSIIKWTEVVE